MGNGQFCGIDALVSQREEMRIETIMAHGGEACM